MGEWKSALDICKLISNNDWVLTFNAISGRKKKRGKVCVRADRDRKGEGKKAKKKRKEKRGGK